MNSAQVARNQSQEEARLRTWARSEVERGIPRQHVEDALLLSAHQVYGGPVGSALVAACLIVASEVALVMEKSHAAAELLERSGCVDDAVRQYEENVRDCCLRADSYVRLIGIYRQRGDAAAVDRVERALIENLHAGDLLTQVPVE